MSLKTSEVFSCCNKISQRFCYRWDSVESFILHLNGILFKALQGSLETANQSVQILINLTKPLDLKLSPSIIKRLPGGNFSAISITTIIFKDLFSPLSSI